MGNHAAVQKSYSFATDEGWADFSSLPKRQSAEFPVSGRGRTTKKWLNALSEGGKGGDRPELDTQGTDRKISSSSVILDDRRSSSIASIPDLKSLSETDRHDVFFISAQEWDGYVDAVGENSFEGVVTPIGAKAEHAEDAVTIPFSMLDDHVAELIRPGVLFRMAAGHVRIKRQVIHGVRIYIRKNTERPTSKWLSKEAFEAAFGE